MFYESIWKYKYSKQSMVKKYVEKRQKQVRQFSHMGWGLYISRYFRLPSHRIN